MKPARFLSLTFLIFIFAFSTLSYAGVPQMINYQGKITTPVGALVDTTVPMIFSIYDDSTGGSPIWADTHSAVVVDKGVFNVLLGSFNPVTGNIFDGTVQYLGLKVGSDPEASPRKELVSMAYAMRSVKSDTADFAYSIGLGDIDWTFRITDTADTTLITGGEWGIARAGNTLYGSNDSTHVNLGVASTTGDASYDYQYCTVGGGYNNTASGWASTVGGGLENIASDTVATVGGGWSNQASGNRATVGGGWNNIASGSRAFIGGGSDNQASAFGTTIAGGHNNIASGSGATIGGGSENQATQSGATVGGGYNNSATDEYATVAGGNNNEASNYDAFVGGGYSNHAAGSRSTVCGGDSNYAGSHGTVAGGSNNRASSGWSTIGGGQHNATMAYYATVPGGFADTAWGECSFAAGDSVRITYDGDYTFAFGRDFRTSTPGAVVFYDRTTADEIKVGIDTTDPGNILTVRRNSPTDPIADAWTVYSSVRWKENIVPVDNALDKVMALRGVHFDWKGNGEQDIGMIAEEVGKVIPEVVSYEENGNDAQAIDYARLTSVLVEAIKEQQKEIELLKREIEELKK